MGVVKGLKAINQFNEEREAARKERERPKTVWFKLEDKQKVEVAFLQELDDSSPNFSAKNDLGVIVVEHTNPDNWKRKAVCTIDDEGQCYGCERHKEDYTAGWKGKPRLYINALVKEEGKEPYVAVISQSTSGQSITPTLIEEAEDEDATITTKWYSLSKSGKGTETSYTLRAKKEHGLNVEDYEVFDLKNVYREVPYEKQEAHYLDGETRDVTVNAETAEASASAGDASGSASVVW